MTWEWVVLILGLVYAVLTVWSNMSERRSAGPGLEQLKVDIQALKSEANAQVKVNEEIKKFMSLHAMAAGFKGHG